MNYAMVYLSDERISNSRSQGLLGSGRNLFCPWIPFGFKFKILTLRLDLFQGAGQPVELPFFPVDEVYLTYA